MAALNNRGNALQGLERLTEAMASYDQALAIRPDSAELLHNRGNALLKLQRYQDALASYEQGLRCDPNYQPAFAGLATAALLTCDWARTTKLVSKLKADVAAGHSTVNPFTFLGYCDSPTLQLKCAQAFIRRAVPHSLKPFWTGELWRHDKLRIAYLSADFREHATAFLMAELFEQHDRSRFEVLGMSYGGPEQSEMRSRLLKAFDQFHDVARQTDQAIAALLHQLQADIVIDLKGSTYGARPAILAYRPAPIQVTYLGYPGTTGADFIDYIIADSTVLPFDQQPYYSENFVHLPDCYQVNVSQRRIAPATPIRHAGGLPDTGFVFCCFNNNYKITPPLFDVWTRLLHAVDGSVLWLLRDSSGAETNLRDAARSRGIDPDRLVFAERVELAVHLARHRLADLFLDTLPYNAHTTASDALWMGLPVLTCLGTAFAGRVAASLLCAVGLADLVTQSLPAYETLALKLAREPALLASFKHRLQRNKSTYPLFDTRRFCHHIETAYTTMWELWQRGEQPHSFKIKEQRC
jgi:predicted O-linked N-acetylglucosamine transferase (SPINDLY family)